MEQNNKELEQAKENLKLMLETQDNKKYSDWDNVIIQVMNGDKPVLNSRMMRQDLEALGDLQGQCRGDLMDMLVTAMEDEIKNADSKEA
jgi:hypothetical protein